METVTDFISLGSQITTDSDCSHEIKRCLLLGWKATTNRQCIKKQSDYFANKGLSSQTYGFSSSNVWMWELDNKKGWVLKNWCLSTAVLEKTLGSPLDCKEIKPVNPKGNQSWIFTGKTDTEAEAPILWPSDAKSRLTGKDPDAGKDWRQEEKGTTEDEMVEWHHLFNHLMLCNPLLLLPSILPSSRVFSNESTVQVAKVLELHLQHQSFQRVFRIDSL